MKKKIYQEIIYTARQYYNNTTQRDSLENINVINFWNGCLGFK